MSTNNVEQGRSRIPSRDEYLKAYTLLVELEGKAATSFDKTVITLAAGALGLSITFINQIAQNPTHKFLLAIAWICFGVALLSILASFLVCQYAMRRQRDIIGEYYETKDPEKLKAPNCPDKCTGVFNSVSIGALSFGVLFLCWFSILNLK